MELVYSAPKGCRVKRYFWGIQVEGMWFCKKQHKWVKYDEIEGGASNVFQCSTERAFIRHIRKHPEIKNQNVWLVNRYYTDSYDYSISVYWGDEGCTRNKH